MKRIVLNAVFATLAVAVGCIIGWAFSLGAGAGLGGVNILQSYSHQIRTLPIPTVYPAYFLNDTSEWVVGDMNKTVLIKT